MKHRNVRLLFLLAAAMLIGSGAAAQAPQAADVVTLSTGVSEYKALNEGKRPEDAYNHLRALGLVETAKTASGPEATVTLACPA